MSERLKQRRLHCPCGRAKLLARGLCATCYTLQRQDRAYFGGLREQVLARDGHRCRGCGAPERGKRTLAVHHRRPGVSTLASLITLCPGCHARVSRTRVLIKDWPELLRLLWREQHPHAHEQRRLDFAAAANMPAPEAGGLFAGMGDRCQGRDRRQEQRAAFNGSVASDPPGKLLHAFATPACTGAVICSAIEESRFRGTQEGHPVGLCCKVSVTG